jgi:hypothetical protein
MQDEAIRNVYRVENVMRTSVILRMLNEGVIAWVALYSVLMVLRILYVINTLSMLKHNRDLYGSEVIISAKRKRRKGKGN